MTRFDATGHMLVCDVVHVTDHAPIKLLVSFLVLFWCPESKNILVAAVPHNTKTLVVVAMSVVHAFNAISR